MKSDGKLLYHQLAGKNNEMSLFIPFYTLLPDQGRHIILSLKWSNGDFLVEDRFLFS